jgi:diguanylate cyclase (GGDEF)-like protein
VSRRHQVVTLSAADVTPLCERMAALLAFRAATVAMLAVLGLLTGVPVTTTLDPLAAAYLVGTAALTVLCRVSHRSLRLVAFAAGLVADAVFLDHRHGVLEEAGLSPPTHSVIAALLVAVCLLGSVRSGLGLAAMLSVLPWLVRDEPAAGLSVELLALWAVVAATAAAAAVHQREARRRHRDVAALQALATSLHHDASPAAVGSRVLDFAAGHLGVRCGAVVSEQGGSLHLVAGHGVAADLLPGTGPSPALALAALSRGPTVHPPVDRGREPWLGALLPGARRLVAVRLDVGLQERTWLLLELPGRRGGPVERHWTALLGQVAAMSALALDRVRLLADVTVRASHDPLTGVPNRRALDELLDQLTARHRRAGDGFAVVMVDVDRFKAINDTLGHATGDAVLRRVAATLRGQLRADETVARYGGEEFAVVLPGADTAAAAAAAERLRLALHGIDEPVTVTASFGVAAVPGDARTGTDAIALADTALLRAKHDGRDRVAVAAGDPRVAVAPRRPGGQ